MKRNPIKTILEIGSFQKAAEHLNYAQSTVTPQMLQLEQEFSIKLFEKIGRIMKLTQAGKGLIPYIDNVIEVVQQMESYGKENQELTGTLRIADSETLLACQMPQILKNPFGKRNQSFQYRGDKTTCKRESRDCVSASFYSRARTKE